jgi:ribosome maturation factor RimP
MISKELVETLVLKELSEEYFVVNISIKKGNFIEIVIDGDQGVNIQKCVDVSRSVEGSLDREAEDFELSVSSAGLGKPFKVYRQYIKNIGKEVEVTPAEGKPISGIIKQVDEDGFDLQVSVLERPENSKKKVEVVKTHRFAFNSMPKVKNIISFK